MATYITKEGQSIFDLAIQLYGDITQTFTLIDDNPVLGNITNDIPSLLEITFTPQSNQITNQIALRQKDIATINVLGELEPEEVEDMALTRLYRSKQSGFWDELDTWQTKDSKGSWVDAATIPGQLDEVRIQGDQGHSIDLRRNEQVFNFSFNPSTGVASGVYILETERDVDPLIKGWNLDIFGSPLLYDGSPDEFLPALASLGGVTDLSWIQGDGSLTFRGGSREIYPNAFSSPNRWWSGAYQTKIILDSKEDALISEEPSTLIVNGFILQGALQSIESVLFPDGSLSTQFLRTFNNSDRTTGDLFIGNRGRVVGWSDIVNNGSNPVDNFTVEEGGEVEVISNDSTDANNILATNFDYKGTEIYVQDFNQLFYEASGGADFKEKSTVLLGGSGLKKLQEADSTVHNNLRLQGTATLDLNAFNLKFGPNASLTYQNDDRTTGSTEWPNTGGASNDTIPFNLVVDSCTITLNENKTIRGKSIILNNGSIDLNGNTLTELDE